MKKYYQSDKMQEMINWEIIMSLPRCAGGHDEQMRVLFKDSEVIAHYNSGGYQGVVATCVKLSTGEFAIYDDYYGTCSGCDAWENATDDEVKKLCIDLANRVFIFQNIYDMVEFIETDFIGTENMTENSLRTLTQLEPGIKEFFNNIKSKANNKEV
jgi:hypothetical protein